MILKGCEIIFRITGSKNIPPGEANKQTYKNKKQDAVPNMLKLFLI